MNSNNCGFMLQETWLSSSIDSSLITPMNYMCFRQDRLSKCRGGGVATFINTEWCKSA